MKNILKSFFLVALVVSFFSCNEDDNDSTGTSNDDLGWVQFLETNPDAYFFTQVLDTELSLDVNIQVPKTSNDLTISYDLVSVSGLDPNSVLSNTGKIVVPAGLTSWVGPGNSTGIDYAYLANIDIDLTELPILTENMVFDVVLTSTSSSSITAGIKDEKPTTQRIIICSKFLSKNTFTSDSYSVDLRIGPNSLVTPYDTTLLPVAGQCGTFSTISLWGPEFVSFACGGCVPVGSFLNPANIVINDDNTLTVISEFGDGTGTYDPVSGNMQINIIQNLFTAPFSVDITLNAN